MEAEVYIHNPKKFTRLEMDADRVNLIAGFSFDETLQQYSLVSLTDKTIELVSDSITLTADKVYINGSTTFDSLFTDGTTTIDGGKITTGTITADELNVSSLSAISSDLGNITGGTISIGDYFNVDIHGSTTIKRGYIADNFTIDQYSIWSGDRTSTYIEMVGAESNFDPTITIQTEDNNNVIETVNINSSSIGFTNHSNGGATIGLYGISYTSSDVTIDIGDGTSGEALYMYIENDDSSLTNTVTIEAETGNITASGDTSIGGDVTIGGVLRASHGASIGGLQFINRGVFMFSASHTNYCNWYMPTETGTLALTSDFTWTGVARIAVPTDCNEVMFELRYITSQGYVQRTFTIIPTALLKAVTSSYTQSIYIGDQATLGGRVTYTYSSTDTSFNFSFYTYYEGASVSGTLLTYYR